MAVNPATNRRPNPGPSLTTRAWQTLAGLLLVIATLVGLNWIAVSQGGAWTPRLALDLEGGTQVVLQAQLPEGQADPSPEQMAQAVAIIRQRIDASGVSEAEITTQGGRNIVVNIPGELSDAQRERIENSARLDFRPVIEADSAANSQIIPPDQLPPTLASTPTAVPTDASDPNGVPDTKWLSYLQFDCAKDIPNASDIAADQPLITCSEDGREKYALGPVEVSGENIKNAYSGMVQTSQGATTGQWAVNIEFDETGTQQFAAVTQRLNSYQSAGSFGGPQQRNRFAVTLDNRVIVAPSVNTSITDGKAQITGNFTQEEAAALADQLKFGALPFTFQTQSTQAISATLGESQLMNGLIAGAIGLALVVIYSLFQYRALGFVTIASLAISALLTYFVVTFLSSQEGYRLSLAGVAGLIVAIGITADSFIVYFERIKDEIRDGRGLVSAVEAGWQRAIRTILVSDAVNLLVAGVLFFVAVGNVRGFALTLFITTVIDLIVVTLFTHPIMRLLANTRFFGNGHPASGLNPERLGAASYRGRGEFRPQRSTRIGRRKPVETKPSLAERKSGVILAEEEAPDAVDIDEIETPEETEIDADGTTIDSDAETDAAETETEVTR